MFHNKKLGGKKDRTRQVSMFLFDFIFPLPLYLYTEFNSWLHLWDLPETEKGQWPSN